MRHDDCKYMSKSGRETEEWKCKMLGFHCRNRIRKVNRMADLIPYTIIMERVKDDIDFIAEQAYERGKRDILEQLQTTPTDHVLCKDCKHSEHWYRDKGRCFLWHEEGIDVFEDGYCNYAERRTE